MYLPEEVFSDAASWAHGPYGDKIWGKYGFVDSLDIDQNWFADAVIGITVGPAFLSIANLDPNTSIWKDFMTIPEVKNAISRITAAKQVDLHLPQQSGGTPKGQHIAGQLSQRGLACQPAAAQAALALPANVSQPRIGRSAGLTFPRDIF